MTVSVWLLRTDQPAGQVRTLAGLLDPAELARAAGMTEPAVHAEFVVSHAAARCILADLLAVPAASLRWRHGPSGKPELACPATALQVSLSHSDGLAAVAVADRPVGVDVQRQRDGAGLARMAARYFPPAEARQVGRAGDPVEAGRRFGVLWTRKEACAKVGGGRLIPALGWPSGPAGPGRFRSGDPATGAPVLIEDLPVPEGFHGAVAVAGDALDGLVVRCWQPAGAAVPAC